MYISKTVGHILAGAHFMPPVTRLSRRGYVRTLSCLCRVRSIQNIPDKVHIAISCVIQNEGRSRDRVVAPGSALACITFEALAWITVGAFAWIMVGVWVRVKDRVDATSRIPKKNSWKYERILQNRNTEYIVWVCLDQRVVKKGEVIKCDYLQQTYINNSF